MPTSTEPTLDSYLVKGPASWPKPVSLEQELSKIIDDVDPVLEADAAPGECVPSDDVPSADT